METFWSINISQNKPGGGRSRRKGDKMVLWIDNDTLTKEELEGEEDEYEPEDEAVPGEGDTGIS